MNKPRETKNLLVALDIGTSKIIAIVAEITPDGALEILGLGQHPSKGLKKGVVVNIEATVTGIQRALEEAELMADVKIKDVMTGIAARTSRALIRTAWWRSRIRKSRNTMSIA